MLAATCAGVVLAAGSSVRMGRNKLLLDLGGETVVRRAARTACAAGLDPVVVVTGHEREAVEAELHGLRCSAVHNDRHALGHHTSVGAGVAALDGGCAAAVVVLADMPFVTADMLRSVAARHAETGAPLVVSRYGGATIAPPILYDRSLFGELTRLDRHCGRGVVKRHRAAAVEVDWPLSALRDLDRPSDYAAARLELRAASEPTAASEPAAASNPAPEPAHG